MRGLNRIAVFFAVVAVVAWTMVALSIAQTIHSPDTGQPQQVAEPAPPYSGSSREPLSQQLSRSGGVIRPHADVDPGLSEAPPADGKTPVIPPPGTAGRPGATPK